MFKRSTVQKEILLNESTFSKMKEEERKFWIDFLEEVRRVIEDKERDHEKKPYTPTPFLEKEYQKAIITYNGAKYYQIKRLQEIFVFEKK